MSDINWGTQAFPTEGGENSGSYADTGMYMRQYYAAKAMQALIAIHWDAGKPYAAQVADQAVEYADALIARMEKP